MSNSSRPAGPIDAAHAPTFSHALQALATRAPRTGVPFLEAFKVHYGPPGLLGRFFLSADTRLKERGITLQFITMEELVILSRDNADNWGSPNPMFDPSFADISPGTMCLVGIDTTGVIRTCIAAKPIDSSAQTFGSVIDAGGFLSLKPGCNVENLQTTINAPFALEKRGLVAFCGLVWVHPEARGLRLPSIFAHLMFACVLTLWNPDYLIGFVNHATYDSALNHRYYMSHGEEAMTITRNGEFLVKLVLLWTSAEQSLAGLGRYLDELWPQIDAAVIARNRQQSA